MVHVEGSHAGICSSDRVGIQSVALDRSDLASCLLRLAGKVRHGGSMVGHVYTHGVDVEWLGCCSAGATDTAVAKAGM